MTLNAKIIETVTPIIPVCVPDLLVPEAGESVPEEYCTFLYDLVPEGLGDNAATLSRALVSLHYFAPLRASTLAKRKALRQAIEAEESFSFPGVENASDQTGQHFVFEFEALGADLEG